MKRQHVIEVIDHLIAIIVLPLLEFLVLMHPSLMFLVFEAGCHKIANP